MSEPSSPSFLSVDLGQFIPAEAVKEEQSCRSLHTLRRDPEVVERSGVRDLLVGQYERLQLQLAAVRLEDQDLEEVRWDGHVVLADDLVPHPVPPVLLRAREVERSRAAVHVTVQLGGGFNWEAMLLFYDLWIKTSEKPLTSLV